LDTVEGDAVLSGSCSEVGGSGVADGGVAGTIEGGGADGGAVAFSACCGDWVAGAGGDVTPSDDG
jgi:hypothetical protein